MIRISAVRQLYKIAGGLRNGKAPNGYFGPVFHSPGIADNAFHGKWAGLISLQPPTENIVFDDFSALPNLE